LHRLRINHRLGAALLLAALAALVFPLAGNAIVLRAGDLIIRGDGGFSPTRLPRDHNAPISLHGGGKITTVSGELPPVLKTIDIKYDRHGSVETTGLPVCTQGKLQSTTVAQARRACGGAIVGKGHGTAVIKFPEQAPIPASSPITIFNGPKVHGNYSVLAHAYLTQPIVTTFIVPVVIERIHQGVYGYETVATIPKIAGGSGVPISGFLKVGKKWTYKGRKHSYVNARCQTGRLQAFAKFTFKDGTALAGSIFKPCQVRK
jgi:hypothetical protein